MFPDYLFLMNMILGKTSSIVANGFSLLLYHPFYGIGSLPD